MSHPFERLLQLQAIDLELDQAQARLEAIERGVPLRALEEQLQRADTQLERALRQRQQEQRRAQREEAEAQALREERLRLEGRLYGGEVASVKEMEKIQARIEHLRQQADQRETAALEAMERLQALEEQIGRLSEQKQQVEQALARQRSVLAGEAESLRKQVGALTSRRAEARAQLPADLLTQYDLHRRRGGVVLAVVEQDRCGQCGVTLPLALVNRARKRQGLEACENCGRLLIWVGESS